MPPHPDTRPSVLLITLDTTRADHLGPYGYAAAETPTYDALARHGRTFTRAYSSSPLTIPAHATLFTGRAPPSHGVRDNGDFVLPPEAVTLAERFKDAGYRTLAFTAAFPTHRRWGLAQGFDVYVDPMQHDAVTQDWSDQRPANEVVDDALVGLAGVPGPVFVWVHLFDAHWPYDPPEPWRSRHALPYDGEIAFADSQVGRLLEAFDAAWPGHLTLVVGDHGEGLGDGGEQTHGFLLHDGTLHVPLILAGPGVPFGREDDPVSQVDVAPTLLDLAGIPRHAGLQGRSLLDGGSEAIYSEALTGQFNLGLAPLRARTDGDGRTMRGGWTGYYPFRDGRVVTTPTPNVPLRELEAKLDALAAELGEGLAPAAALAGDDVERLAALGYLAAGDVLAPAGTVDPRDVIDVVPATWAARQHLRAGDLDRVETLLTTLDARMPGAFGVRHLHADLLRARGRLDEALEALVALHADAPGASLAQQVGELTLLLGDPLEAELWFQEALDHLGNDPHAMAGLVRTALAAGEVERARELSLRFLVVHPDLAELHLVLAELLLLDQRPRDALAEAQAGLALLPWSSWALSVTAAAHWDLGEPERAIDLLSVALDRDRFDVPLRLLLGAWLLEVGRLAEAQRAVRPAARLAPGDPVVQGLWAEVEGRLQRR